MKYSKLRQHKIIIVAGLVLTFVSLAAALYIRLVQKPTVSSTGNKIKISEEITYTSEKEVKEAQDRNGIPFDRGSVNASDIDYYWIDETVVDGSFSCYVFNNQTYQIYGTTYTTAGFGSPSKSGRIYYQNQEYGVDFVDQTIDSVCSRSF